MKRTVLWALGALNLILLASLLAPYVGQNEAMAQRAGGGGGRRPDLLLVPGEPIGGGNSGIVYVIDTANRQLGAMSLNVNGKNLDTAPPEDLDRIFQDRDAAGPDNRGNRKN